MTADGLVGAAVDSDPAAVDTVLRWVRPLILKYCRARIGPQETAFASADDVAQDVCLAVVTALPTYRDQGRPFLAWVYGIAAHKVADARRLAARNPAEPVAEVPDTASLGSPDLEDRLIRGEQSEWMNRVLDTLPAKQREVLILRVVWELSAAETAEVVGSTPGAVRVTQHRALGRLRERVQDETRDRLW